MAKNTYSRPAWTRNGSIRTDLPLPVFAKSASAGAASAMPKGSLCCIGEVYLRTPQGLVRIK